MTNNTNRKLFSPVQIGPVALRHRVVMAPLTRSRSEQPGDVPGKLMLEYYGQRASDGGFIITEATTISISSRGWYGAPGLYSDAQVDGWRKITGAVHAKGGSIFSQLWHVGRSSHVSMTDGAMPVAPSVQPGYWLDATPSISTASGWFKPSPHRALDIAEIPMIVEDYRRAAERAKAAGFDGVELHAANGYLPDQFLQDSSNKRTDAYGGSIENRSRFLLEVVEAMASVWGGDRVAVRIGPGGTWNGMSDSNPAALFDYLGKQLNRFGLAYLHIIEPRVKGNVVITEGQAPTAAEQLRKIFTGKLIAAGGFEPDSAEAIVENGTADLVAFGRHFVANPDLPERIRRRLPLNDYDRDTFYTFDFHGYTDYPFYNNKETKMETEQNVVLVHGAWADGSSWSKVISLLQKKGVRVTAVQLPLTSLDDDIGVTRRILAAQKRPTVLVGHSYGGVVISGAADGMPDVAALVYIAGFGLDEGESIDGLSKQGPAPAGAASLYVDDNNDLWINRDGFAQAFVADADPEEARVMAVTQKPLSMSAFTAKSGPPAWKHIPSWYLVSAKDQMIPPAAEELMAKRMGATTRTVDASHASLVSHPVEVADLIMAAVESVANAEAGSALVGAMAHA